VWTIVVAAGSGTRFGGPKQFERLGDRRVLDWALTAARAASEGVVLVLGADHLGESGHDGPVVAGGATRSASVRRGLAVVPTSAEVVVVHDAARPFADPPLFHRVITAVRTGAAGAVPGVPVTDTVKLVDDDGAVVDTPERARLRAVQTPQAFSAPALRAAHAGGGEATDDAALIEAAGGRVVVVAGDPGNRKITEPDDLAWARRRVEGAGAGPDAGAEAGPSVPPAVAPIGGLRIGQGFDVHRFVAEGDPPRPLVLGGVVFDGPGLVGHSDADAVAHAVTDALLGAAGLGDIGQQFPDTDPRFAGADSIGLLVEAVARVRAAGWVALNVDCSVICERPKLAPRKDEMQARLSAAVGAPVTVKGRRAEGLGALGRVEGIACFATALLTATGPATTMPA
jgi:2-C-methyl-D-erythritol 4-phosphate cytidylyltransferase/2-C-methyl-D-erythritol 2,4-cyclodiphosphate synthase